MDPLSYLLVGTLTALGRCLWVLVVLPAWRVLKWALLIAAGAWATNRLEREFEDGAYQAEAKHEPEE